MTHNLVLMNRYRMDKDAQSIKYPNCGFCLDLEFIFWNFDMITNKRFHKEAQVGLDLPFPYTKLQKHRTSSLRGKSPGES